MSDQGARSLSRDWAKRFAARLFIVDLVAVVVSVGTAQALRFGVSPLVPVFEHGAGAALSYTVISALLVPIWLLVLEIFRTRDARYIGAGSTEYRLVVTATLWVFGIGAIVFFVFQIPFARAYLLIALPLGLVLLLFGRWLNRQWLIRRRRQGEGNYRVLLIGSSNGTRATAAELASNPAFGYQVVGAVISDAEVDEVPFLGEGIEVTVDLEAVPAQMENLDADTLLITGSAGLNPSRIRDLSWVLEPRRQHLVMVPSLTDVAGPRIHTRPVAGLHLMHVETPTFAGPQLLLKRLFDLVASAGLILGLSPLLLSCALAIKLSSPGPVLFRQERVGRGGTTFQMMKFRSMVVGAEDQLAGLLDRQRDAGNEVLFKLRDDPRVTRVGRFMRRYSLDELPQLFNVVAGTMSLVGPRPPLPREVEHYDDRINRKFLVKPGITGLWQVNGRSSLSWEESVRLDLYYVENWSLLGDFVILWRTIRAVAKSDGAY